MVRKLRTLNLIHFVFHAFHFAVDYSDLIADAVCDPQVICKHHPSLLLRQSVKLLERILQVILSGQLPQDLCYAVSVQIPR